MNIAPEKLNNQLWVFPPNKACNGGTSWWLGCDPEPVLIDCPHIDELTIQSLKELSGGRKARIILTSRESHGKVQYLSDLFEWPVLIQEQEAYLLPNISLLETFENHHTTISGLQLLWTPGASPGSCVLYAPKPRNVLFCGRFIIPLNSSCLGISRNRRTFHWTRQQKSLKKLLKWIPPDAFPLLASGAGLAAISPEKLMPWDSLST